MVRDEASLAHWEQELQELPSDAEALARMTELRHVSKVRSPSPGQATKQVVLGGRALRVLKTFGATPAS